MTTAVYAAGYQAYRDAGWTGVICLKRRNGCPIKHPPPVVYCDKHRPKTTRAGTATCPDCVHYTGYAGVDPSYADVLQWAEQHPDGNLALRVPDGIVGIDVDAYGDKTGGKTLAEAIRRWDLLPPTSCSTSRPDDPISGIRLFRVPPGTLLEDTITFPELGIGDIELIQFHHRYVMSWPSIHPEERPYLWRDDAGQLVGIPNPAELPELPSAWINGLRAKAKADDGAGSGGERYDVRLALTEREPSPKVAARLAEAVAACYGGSRHDHTRGHVLTLLRFGQTGEPGVGAALQALQKVFVAAVGPDRKGGETEAREEFKSFVEGERVARLLAVPDNQEWIRILAEKAAPAAPAPEIDEEAFWTSCDELRACREYARAVRVGPWAMLGSALTIAAATIPPFVVLPVVIGDYANTNLYVNLCGASGTHKGAAIAAARAWLRSTPSPDAVKPGSGQGVAKCFAYVTRAAQGRPEQRGKRWTAVAVIGEVDTLTAAGSMTGSCLWTELRSAWSAERVGHDYADASKAVVLQPHRFRLCMVVGVQPLRAGPLFDDVDAGTPQRFVWLPVNDPGAPAVRPEATPPTLTLPPWSLPSGSGDGVTEYFTPTAEQWHNLLHEPADRDDLIVLRIPPEAAAAMDAKGTNTLRRTPWATSIDAHRLLCQLKVAAALMRLRRHDEVTTEDWHLAGTLMAVSDCTCARVRAELTADAGRRNVRTAKASGERKVVEARFIAEAEAADVARVAGVIVARLERADGHALSGGDVSRAAGRDRALVPKALEYLKIDGRIAVESVEYRGQTGVKVTLLDEQTT